LSGEKLSRAIGERMRFSREENEGVAVLIRDHLRFFELPTSSESTIQRFLRAPHFTELLKLHHADVAGGNEDLMFYEFCRKRLTKLKKMPQLLSGDDFLKLGLKPGPKIAELLRAVEDGFFEGRIKNRAQALEWARGVLG